MFERYRPGLGNGESKVHDVKSEPVVEQPQQQTAGQAVIITHKEGYEKRESFWRTLVTGDPEKALVARATAILCVGLFWLRRLGIGRPVCGWSSARIRSVFRTCSERSTKRAKVRAAGKRCSARRVTPVREVELIASGLKRLRRQGLACCFRALRLRDIAPKRRRHREFPTRRGMLRLRRQASAGKLDELLCCSAMTMVRTDS
jgi:hypothetical protein